MGAVLEPVAERLEGRRLAAPPRERLPEQPVGEPGVSGEEGAVEVRADCPPHATALETVLPVVPEAVDDATERPRALVEIRSSGMVLEAGKRPDYARSEFGREEDVADHPALTGDGEGPQ